MWYIGTFGEVTAYNDKVNGVKHYKGHITNNWANPLQHPNENRWAIIANSGVEPDEGSDFETVEKLSDDWFPSDE
tara:strand:- start:902 stop:1126 length:225 start_codon:yes stop_codon:yes gene_type:complete